jgi:hypothetical protein
MTSCWPWAPSEAPVFDVSQRALSVNIRDLSPDSHALGLRALFSRVDTLLVCCREGRFYSVGSNS